MSSDQTIRASLVQSVVSQCPNTKVVMSGYSQGGQLVHNAAKLLPAATMARVSSVVIFGDPGKPYTSRGSKHCADIQQ
jgi:cutinase